MGICSQFVFCYSRFDLGGVLQCDVCPWPFSYISHGEVGVFSLGLMAMQS